MAEMFKFFIDNPSVSQQGIFFGLFVCLSYYCRKDSNAGKEDLKSMNEKMFDVVNNNTRASTELMQIIKDRIK